MMNCEICCKECETPMQWRWSQGTSDAGRWVISCRGVGCFMYGASFLPDTYDQSFAKHRAYRCIMRAQQGIVYRDPAITLDALIEEGVRRAIIPANWHEWGTKDRVARPSL